MARSNESNNKGHCPKKEKNMEYTITKNEQYKSVEVRFDKKPGSQIISALKSIKFRWNPTRGIWYGFAEENAIKATIDGKNEKESRTNSKAKEAPEANRTHPFRVGDVFVASWGYEQTNLDFFQITELVGSSSCRIQQVHPRVKEESGVGYMSRNVSFEIKPGEILPPDERSVFIKDAKRGDLKRITKWGDTYAIKIRDYATAFPYKGEKLYESWYA